MNTRNLIEVNSTSTASWGEIGCFIEEDRFAEMARTRTGPPELSLTGQIKILETATSCPYSVGVWINSALLRPPLMPKIGIESDIEIDSGTGTRPYSATRIVIGNTTAIAIKNDKKKSSDIEDEEIHSMSTGAKPATLK
ncbi:hypothetical protein EVAR_58050_1 [Eumeta japonica]|uniref:Uncharacterized protein n=1 Tax=Eumeta variegata TaxID=151549 RepID=A0A4C1Z1W5_EUMVA|nr:hypothetical protein EVAR_58050_1 [Eumeta japonica]